MLWLCLYFSRLPLTSLSGAETFKRPLVVTQNGHVMQCNRLASQAGIEPGMATAAARAISHTLRTCEYAADREHHALEGLATWAGQFTPRVSLAPPRALLLEIGGSLEYFGGLETLRQRIRQELSAVGQQGHCGIAPTPTAAWLLARHGDERPLTRRDELATRLGSLPVAVLDPAPATAAAIRGLGCQTIADLRAMPAAGLARRLGQPLLAILQRAYGERPDPRADWHSPEHFHAHIELPAETHRQAELRPGLEHLIGILCGQLRRQEAGISHLEFQLQHADGTTTRLQVGLRQPGRDPARLIHLCQQKLEQQPLPAGVVAITLQADNFHSLDPGNRDLLGEDRAEDTMDAGHTLIENLGNRLGHDRVRALAVVDEHRPEHAWRYIEPMIRPRSAAVDEGDPGRRPLWLLEQPAPLQSRDGQPHHQGPLVLEHGPERIETGWWDGQDICRDYYRARTPEGQHLWVFRDRRGPRQWYLHGLFA